MAEGQDGISSISYPWKVSVNSSKADLTKYTTRYVGSGLGLRYSLQGILNALLLLALADFKFANVAIEPDGGLKNKTFQSEGVHFSRRNKVGLRVQSIQSLLWQTLRPEQHWG